MVDNVVGSRATTHIVAVSTLHDPKDAKIVIFAGSPVALLLKANRRGGLCYLRRVSQFVLAAVFQAGQIELLAFHESAAKRLTVFGTVIPKRCRDPGTVSNCQPGRIMKRVDCAARNFGMAIGRYLVRNWTRSYNLLSEGIQ